MRQHVVHLRAMVLVLMVLFTANSSSANELILILSGSISDNATMAPITLDSIKVFSDKKPSADLNVWKGKGKYEVRLSGTHEFHIVFFAKKYWSRTIKIDATTITGSAKREAYNIAFDTALDGISESVDLSLYADIPMCRASFSATQDEFIFDMEYAAKMFAALNKLRGKVIPVTAMPADASAIIHLHGMVKDEKSDKGIKKYTVELVVDSVRKHIAKLEGGGKFSAQLGFDHIYSIVYSAPGYCTKVVEINTFGVSRKARKSEWDIVIDGSLAKRSDIDMAYFERTPLAKMTYSAEEKLFSFDQLYSEKMTKEMAKMKAKLK